MEHLQKEEPFSSDPYFNADINSTKLQMQTTNIYFDLLLSEMAKH